MSAQVAHGHSAAFKTFFEGLEIVKNARLTNFASADLHFANGVNVDDQTLQHWHKYFVSFYCRFGLFQNVEAAACDGS